MGRTRESLEVVLLPYKMLEKGKHPLNDKIGFFIIVALRKIIVWICVLMRVV